MDDIQSWWEVPSIAHFCSLFRVAFNLLDFDIEELEEALLTDGTEDTGSSLIQELIVRLLCGCLGNNGISTFNYQMFLRRLFRQKCREYGKDNPFDSDIDFQFLPLRTKVEILHALCDFRLDADDVLDVLKNLDSDSLRIHPLGYDDNKSAYWYFYGTRLYREDYPRAKKKKKKCREKHGRKSRSESESEAEMGCGEWQVVCYTEEDWERLADKLEDSECKDERALYSVLSEDFLPEIPRLFEEKERLQRKRLMELQPRRQSSRLEKLKHQKEVEKKAEERKLSESKKDCKDQKEKERREQNEKERRERDAKRAREHRALVRSRSHTNSECSSSSRTESSSKPRARQTNNSLASATGQIIIQPSRQKLRTSQVFCQSVEDLRTGLYKILDRIKNHEDAWPFLDPVEEEYAPRYYSVIAKPMDLQRMEDKLDAGEYASFGDFKTDFQLIVDNCRKYNGSENEYTEMVGKLQEVFDAAVERYLEAEMSSDEEVAVEFSGVEKGRRKRKLSHVSKNSPPPSHRSDESEADINNADSVKEESEVEDSQKDTESQSSGTRSRHKGRKKSADKKLPVKKPVAIKNVTDIEALELATEQTLKDINKWLDDTPRFSEFSSASNSPSQLPLVDDCDGVASRIEQEYRARLKIRPKDRMDFTRRRFFKDHGSLRRRREVQRTIDRLQPGKSKGNLLSNHGTVKNEETGHLSSTAGTKLKDSTEICDRKDELAPKLSLGSVLNRDVIGFGQHSFEHSDSDVIKKDSDSQYDSSDEKPILPEEDEKNPPENYEEKSQDDETPTAKEKEEPPPALNTFEKKTVPSQNPSKSEKSCTPNLSAWFKAFGLPKSQPLPKKKIELVDENKEKSEQIKVVQKEIDEIISVDDDKDKRLTVVPPLVSPARRQRKASTGSSVSERSSFSQDPTDPLLDGSSPRPSLDEPYLSPQPDPSKTPYHHSPLNGTIKVGFYQDTSFPRGSSDKSSSPREPPTPNCSPREPPSCSPRDIPSCSPREPMASPKSDYPLYSTGSLPFQSPTVNSFDAPVSPYPGHMPYYDTAKSLTDQYKSSQITTEKSVSSYPVKKRIYNEVESPARSSPDTTPTYRGGSFTPTRNAIENDRSFTPTPGRIPTPANSRHTYAPEAALALGLHSITPHLMDPYAEGRLISASYYGGESIYGKNNPTTTTISHGVYPPSTSVVTTTGYTRDDRNYSRVTTNYSDTRQVKVSDSSTAYLSNMSQPTATPVINYSGRNPGMLSPDTVGPSSPLNYSSSNIGPPKTNLPLSVNSSNKSHDSSKEDSPLDFAKVSQNDITRSKESSPVSYPASRQISEVLPSKISTTYNRTIPELSAPTMNLHRPPDIVGGKLSVPPSPLSYSTQQDILAGKINYSHPMSELARFNYPHGVGYNHPMSDLIQAKVTSGSYSNRPMDLMTAGYNRSISDLLPNREVPYQPVSRSNTVSKIPDLTTSKSAALPKKSSKKRKTSDVPSGVSPGFQQYLGQSSSEAIALKTSSVVPGSAFNFGPAPLKDSYTSYLEEMRTSGYFAPHSETTASAKSSSPGPHPPASPYPYLSHAPSRPLSYSHPFINPSYQQYIQKHPDELLRPMVLHQGLLPPSGYPPGYLGIHDAINRSSWL